MVEIVEFCNKYNEDQSGSLHCVDKNLWIGDRAAATNWELMCNKKISCILTVDVYSLPKTITDMKNVKMMSIPVMDLPNEDIISYLEEAYQFIDNGVKEGSVLVHCHEGVSRSPTIVLAYMMRKYGQSFDRAYAVVREKRRFVCPNPGFMAQLKMYEAMQYRIDKSNLQYKMFCLYLAGDRMRTGKFLPQTFAEVIKPDPALFDTQDPRVYKCKKCRRILVSESNIIPHFPKEEFTWRDKRFSSGEGSKNYCSRLYVIEPMGWMKNVSVTLAGKLYCPVCEQKLGSYSWLGCLCPCGTEVTPAFYLVPSKVDKANLVQSIS